MILFQKQKENLLILVKLLENMESLAKKVDGIGLYVMKKPEKLVMWLVTNLQKLIGKKKMLRKQMNNLVEQTKNTLNRLLETIEELRKENKNLKQRLNDIKEGFEGCCYACEPVGMLNQELEAQLKAIEEDGTEEHNAAFDLRRRLAEALVENDQWKDVARSLYSVVLHLEAISKDKAVAVIGDSLYTESINAIKEYEYLFTVEKQ